MQNRRQPEIIAGRVNADGSIASGDGFTVQRSAAGTYNITFAPGFRVISATTGSGSELSYINAWGPNSIQVISSATVAGAAADNNISFIAVGVQQ
jgi:hypothetical protein